LVDKLTRAVPEQSMIFQLPVSDFPEVPGIEGMSDYEHFRPYLFSHQLRYSYGTDKGRETDSWQHETGGLKPAAMIAHLEACGFAAIWINRKGYADNGNALIDGLRDAGRGDTLESTAGDLVCVLLHPSAHPALPPLMEFKSGWYVPGNGPVGENGPGGGMEGRWSSDDPEIEVVNTSSTPLPLSLSFDVSSPIPRKLTIMNGTAAILETDIGPDSKSISNVIARLNPGKTLLLFKTDVPPVQIPGSADKRKFGFVLTHFSVESQERQ
jgi:hypothetical protein